MASAARSREELANTLSHGVGLLGALAATPTLIVAAAGRGGVADVVGASIFGATMILLYLASTSYHAATASRLRDRLQKLEQELLETEAQLRDEQAARRKDSLRVANDWSGQAKAYDEQIEILRNRIKELEAGAAKGQE